MDNTLLGQIPQAQIDRKHKGSYLFFIKLSFHGEQAGKIAKFTKFSNNVNIVVAGDNIGAVDKILAVELT